jgi:hypothetical protein
MVEQSKNVFAGEKREREDSHSEAQEIGSWGRKRHEWLYWVRRGCMEARKGRERNGGGTRRNDGGQKRFGLWLWQWIWIRRLWDGQRKRWLLMVRNGNRKRESKGGITVGRLLRNLQESTESEGNTTEGMNVTKNPI